MTFFTRTVWMVVVFLYAGCTARQGPSINEAKVVDLTYSFEEASVYWPTDQHFRRQETFAGLRPEGYWYASGTYAASEHGGTHIDGPIHFAKQGLPVDQLPLSRLIGPAVVVDIRAACENNRDYVLSVDDLRDWESKHGRIPDGAIVLAHTGWGKFWPDKKQFLGTDKPGDTTNLHFPGFSAEAARFLAGERKVDGVGIDTPSIDHGPSSDYMAHRILYEAGIYGLENVANLDRLPPQGALLIALPMKIKGGTGAPLRLIALLP